MSRTVVIRAADVIAVMMEMIMAARMPVMMAVMIAVITAIIMAVVIPAAYPKGSPSRKRMIVARILNLPWEKNRDRRLQILIEYEEKKRRIMS